MQKSSSLIFWLLLAAMLLVDAVAIRAAIGQSLSGTEYLQVAFHALVIGQLSIVCIGSTLVLGSALGKWIAPTLAVVTATIISTAYAPMPQSERTWSLFRSYFGYYALHAILVCSALWVLQRTSFWARRTGIVRTWRYSLLQVLAIMTATAVLSPALKNNVFMDDEVLVNVVFAASFVALAVAGVAIWLLPWNWVLRLAAYFGFVLLLAILCTAILLGINYRQFDVFEWTYYELLGAYYLIQGIVISIWLGWGQLLPISNTAAADELTS